MDWLDDIVEPEQSIIEQPSLTRAELELQHYLSDTRSREDPLQWWKKMQSLCPTLAQLARKYLCVPASSVPSERVFSSAGYLINKRRACLSAENVNMLLFLNKNLHKLQ